MTSVSLTKKFFKNEKSKWFKRVKKIFDVAEEGETKFYKKQIMKKWMVQKKKMKKKTKKKKKEKDIFN